MTGRAVVTARCRKGHPLAELLAARDGMTVRVEQSAAGYSKAGRVHYRRGGPAGGPLDASMSYVAICACGRPYLVRGRDLAAAAAAGKSVIHPGLLR